MGLTVQDLTTYFSEGAKPRRDWRIGTEYEKFLISRETGFPIAYEGKSGMPLDLLQLDVAAITICKLCEIKI